MDLAGSHRPREARSFTLERDLPALASAIETAKPLAVIISPLSAYLGSKDRYKDAEIRGLLTPLAALAERTRATIIGVMHLTKAQQGGSSTAARLGRLRRPGPYRPGRSARIADIPGRRLLASIKNNLGPMPRPWPSGSAMPDSRGSRRPSRLGR